MQTVQNQNTTDQNPFNQMPFAQQVLPQSLQQSQADAALQVVDEVQPIKVRSIFISDIHLGSAGCKADALLDFLKHYESDYLFLVGDIIDGWQLARRWYWPQAHNDVIQKILRKVRKGTQVVYIPGNHDEFARRFFGISFGGIQISDDYIHTLANGKTIWLTHGDYFDGAVQYAQWLTHIGDVGYEFVLKMNSHLNRLRGKFGLPYWSLSQYLKLKVKKAVQYIGDFETAVAREAKKRNVDGVLCGHIHHAEIREIDGITYYNDGDWVESLSALIEDYTGSMQIITWQSN